MSMTETLDDILAEICTVYDVTGKDLADRIRAAVKRERDGNVQSDVQKSGHNLDNLTIGDVQRMHKAFLAIADISEGMAKLSPCEAKMSIRNLVKVGKPTPRRNCDVYKTELLARDAWLKTPIAYARPFSLWLYDTYEGEVAK